MYLYTGSKGILARKNNIEPMLGHPLLYMKGDEAFSKNDVLVGWGKKSNTKQIKQKAQELGISYWQLEDGFIGYIGHPAKGGKAG